MGTIDRIALVTITSIVIHGAVPLFAQSATPSPVTLDQVVWLAPGLGGAEAVELIRETSHTMSLRSATFAQLLEVLSGIPDVSVHLRPRMTQAGWLGHGQFRIAGKWLVGTIEIAPFSSSPQLRVRALAHELAHLLELACLRQNTPPNGLRKALARRASGSRRPSGLETPFADALEHQVMEEYHRTGSSGRLAELTAKHRVPSCTAEAPLVTAAR